MSCVRSIEDCHCVCHRRPGVKHVAPCCHTCPFCGRNIKRGFYEDHRAECAEEHDNIPKNTNSLRARRYRHER